MKKEVFLTQSPRKPSQNQALWSRGRFATGAVAIGNPWIYTTVRNTGNRKGPPFYDDPTAKARPAKGSFFLMGLGTVFLEYTLMTNIQIWSNLWWFWGKKSLQSVDCLGWCHMVTPSEDFRVDTKGLQYRKKTWIEAMGSKMHIFCVFLKHSKTIALLVGGRARQRISNICRCRSISADFDV